MAKELGRDEFYFIDFVQSNSSYDDYMNSRNSPASCWVNFVNGLDYSTDTRVHASQKLEQLGGFMVGWGKRRAFMKLESRTDHIVYVIQGIGFYNEEDATAFILKWS